jgi:hypothetical protein
MVLIQHGDSETIKTESNQTKNALGRDLLERKPSIVRADRPRWLILATSPLQGLRFLVVQRWYANAFRRSGTSLEERWGSRPLRGA